VHRRKRLIGDQNSPRPQGSKPKSPGRLHQQGKEHCQSHTQAEAAGFFQTIERIQSSRNQPTCRRATAAGCCRGTRWACRGPRRRARRTTAAPPRPASAASCRRGRTAPAAHSWGAPRRRWWRRRRRRRVPWQRKLVAR
jgi:hypothetical protein